ncbi:MAG: hypothetical protein M3463_09990 [Verrucomicrobiota bacterium]|nr:hypothetical protein [Verrucomicrobiota bacterium]
MKTLHLLTAIRPGRRVNALRIALALLMGAGSSALASDLIGVYAFVEKVVLEPDATSPERIRIWGGFAVAEGSGYKYAPARRGSMYFKLPPGKEEAARREWNDLKSLAGSDQLVAFGARYGEKGSVRKADAKPENPDVYPVGVGLTKMKPRQDYGPHKDLITLRQAQQPAATTTPR